MALTGTDLFIVGRGAANYKVTGTQLAAFIGCGASIQVAAAAPTTRADATALQAGDIYYNTTDKTLYTYNGTAWVPQVAGGSDVQSAAAAPTTRSSGTTLQAGDIYYNTTDKTLYTYNGTAWNPQVSGGVDIQAVATAPTTRSTGATLAEGDLYYNTTDGIIYAWDGAAWVAVAAQYGLGLAVSGSAVKVSIPVASAPPATGLLAAQAINGSMYWDDTLGQLFIRYTNGGASTWVAAAPPAGGVPAASAAEAAAGLITTKYSSPATAVAKDAATTTGAALLPSGTTGQQPASPVAGMTRFNSDFDGLEFCDGAKWVILAPNVPVFSSKLSVSTAPVASSVFNKVIFDTVLFDNFGYYNITTGVFRPLKAGYYQINANVGFVTTGSATDLSTYIASLFINGTEYQRGSQVTTDAVSGLRANALYGAVSTIAYMNGTTDFADIRGFYGSSGQAAVIIGPPPVSSTFSAVLVGV